MSKPTLSRTAPWAVHPAKSLAPRRAGNAPPLLTVTAHRTTTTPALPGQQRQDIDRERPTESALLSERLPSTDAQPPWLAPAKRGAVLPRLAPRTLTRQQWEAALAEGTSDARGVTAELPRDGLEDGGAQLVEGAVEVVVDDDEVEAAAGERELDLIPRAQHPPRDLVFRLGPSQREPLAQRAEGGRRDPDAEGPQVGAVDDGLHALGKGSGEGKAGSRLQQQRSE